MLQSRRTSLSETELRLKQVRMDSTLKLAIIPSRYTKKNFLMFRNSCWTQRNNKSFKTNLCPWDLVKRRLSTASFMATGSNSRTCSEYCRRRMKWGQPERYAVRNLPSSAFLSMDPNSNQQQRWSSRSNRCWHPNLKFKNTQHLTNSLLLYCAKNNHRSEILIEHTVT